MVFPAGTFHVIYFYTMAGQPWKTAVKVSGGTFTIRALGNSNENRYIQSVTLNGKAYTKVYIDHTDIAAGGEIVFRMGPEPKVWYCADEAGQKVLKMSSVKIINN